MRATLFLLLLVGCTKPSPSASVPASSASTAATIPDASITVTIAPPDFGPRGAIVVTGYPAKIGTGMDDPADWVGFTSDGAKLGYCGKRGGVGLLDCVTKDAAGKQTVEDDLARSGSANPLDAKKTAALQKWIATSGLLEVKAIKGAFERNPPPLKGDWAYARDIELRVTTTGEPKPFAKLGGALKGEEPVWVATSTPPPDRKLPYHFTVVNGLHLSPDGNELGMITHSFCMEYCDDFEIVRITANAFAGQVYNDTGFRRHKKGEYARSAELFLLATFADAKNDLYVYNLACAWARLGDPKTSTALALAIARGGDKIKTRAKADEDFAAVKSDPWFVDQTR